MCTPRLLRLLRHPLPAYPRSRWRLLSATACLTFLVVAACGDDDGTSPVVTRTYTVAIEQGDGQAALNGTPVAINPTILVRDETGAPAPGIGVTFTVVSGGGSVNAPAQTQSGGLATAGWTMGVLTGNDTSAMNLLRATVTGRHVVGDTVTFLARAWGNRWDAIASLNSVSRMGSGVVNGKIYFFNGAMGPTTWLGATTVYDVATGWWSGGALQPNYGRDQASAVMGDQIYLVGGSKWNGSSTGLVLRTLQVYNPATDQWTTRDSMQTTREQARAFVIDSVLYVMGGRDAGGVTLSSMEAYNPVSNTWSPRAPMPTARRMMGVAAVDGKLYVLGGLDAAGTPLAVVEVYDPATDHWTTGTPLSVARQGPVVAMVNGLLYLISGDAVAYPSLPTVESWNPATGVWTRRHDFPWRCWNSGFGVVDGKIYTMGGDDGQAWYNVVLRYQP